MAQASPASSFLAARSTSFKILVILTLALLPLGLIAALASIEAARANRDNRILAAHLLAGDSADRLNLFIDRAAGRLRAIQREGARGCRAVARDLGGAGSNGIAVASFTASGRLVCSNRPFEASIPLRPAPSAAIVDLDPEDRSVRLIVASGTGWALAELPAATLAQVSRTNAVDGSFDLRLLGNDAVTVQLAAMRTVSFGRGIDTELPIAGGQLRLAMRIESTPLSANEILLLLLPLLMWVVAAATGWVVVDRLILRPLARLQAAVDQYRLRGGRLELPVLTTPAHELRTLGEALTLATATIARHEEELEDGLERQTRLTREVHHRVKNNLQVVASLLSIHGRGVATPEAAAAYASIQRRVDALALVHRSHYAELEVNRGIALKPLIGELAANLRGSLPRTIAAPTILLDVRIAYATQDVAVPVAFLVTEIVEAAMLRMPGTTIAIALQPADAADRARLSFRTPALRTRDDAPDQAFERSQRIVAGLARQLRTTPEIDDDAGLFAIEIAIMPADA